MMTIYIVSFICRQRALGGKINRQRQMKNTDIDTLAVDTGNVGYEMRCMLYNIGAAHSRLAAAQDRSPPLISPSTQTTVETESSSNTALKIACTHLQCAAWTFQVFLHNSSSNPQHFSNDLKANINYKNIYCKIFYLIL